MAEILQEKGDLDQGAVSVSLVDGVSKESLVEELAKADKVKKMVNEITKLVNSVDFLVDDSWIDHVAKGLKKPNIEVRLEKQLKKSVRKKLMDKASELVEPGENIKTPTVEAIDAEVNTLIARRTKEIKETKDSKLRKARNAILASVATDKPESLVPS